MAPLPVLALLLALNGSPQAAPTGEEQRLFAEGLRAFEAGDARAAEKAWKAGYAVGHDPAFLVRIGEAQEKAGLPAEAAESYRHYLREVPDAADRGDIEQRLSKLAPAAPAAPAPAGNAAEAPGEFGAPHPGAGTVPTGRAPGVPAAPTAPAAADPEAAQAGQQETDSGWNRYNITAWIATAATVALLGTAGFFGASAASKKDDVNRLTTYHDEKTGAPLEYSMVAARYEAAMDDGRRLDRYAKVALLGAAGAAVVATIFFVIDETRTPEAALAIGPTPGGAGAVGALTWRF